MSDRYDIETVYIPGLPPKFRVKADRFRPGHEFATRAEAEARRDDLRRRRPAA